MPTRPRLSLPWAIVLGTLLVLGLVLRVYAFDFPPGFLFDEHHFVENARNYLAHRADWNDHPPLGKLIIAASIRALGDAATAWRLPSLIAGVLSIAVGGVTAFRLFRSREAGLVAAALLAADGFLIAYSRAGLLDGFLACSLVLALALSTVRWSWVLAVFSGLLLGSAVNIKFSGVGLAAPLLVSLVLEEMPWRRRAGLWSVVSVVAGGAYFGWYLLGLSLAGQPSGLLAVVNDTQRLLDHHAALTDMKNPYVSGWPTWFLPRRAILMSSSESFGDVRALSMLGNLATWWAAVAVAAVSMGVILKHGLRTVLAGAAEGAGSASQFVISNGRAVLLLLSGALGFLLPWVLSHRDSYLYHFLPTYSAFVLLLAGFVAWLRLRAPRVAFAFLCVALVVAAAYAPLWSSMPIARSQVNARLFLESWR